MNGLTVRHFQFQPRYLDFYSKGEKVVDKNDFMSTIRTFCPHFGQQLYQKKNFSTSYLFVFNFFFETKIFLHFLKF